MSFQAGNAVKPGGNARVIQALFEELDALGVKEFCVCAGARNAAIIACLMKRLSVSADTDAKVYHFIDERGAAFFAMGRIMVDRRPVAVLTTSGTAVAEVLPAMVEAYYQNVRLVAVTADRPSNYVGSGAPQAIEQGNIFGVYASERHEMEWSEQGGLVTHAVLSGDGPVHINVRLEEGLDESMEISPFPEVARSTPTSSSFHDIDSQTNWSDFCEQEASLVVLASGIHPDDVPQAEKFLSRLGAPIVAEATANLDDCESLQKLLLHGGEKALLGMRPERVLRLGAVPSWRWWRDLEKKPDVSVASVSRAPFRGLARKENTSVVHWDCLQDLALQAQPANHDGIEARLQASLQSLLNDYPLSEPAWMRHLARSIGRDASVFLGNSMPIREWNLTAPTLCPGVKYFANRGANGIDGLISSWLGVSESDDSEESWLILGDLSAIYDMNALWPLSQMRPLKRRLVVINNGGGEIFSQVEWLKKMPDDARRVIQNPHVMGFRSWADLWGVKYRFFEAAPPDLDIEQVSEGRGDLFEIWEICPTPVQTRCFWSKWKNTSQS